MKLDLLAIRSLSREELKSIIDEINEQLKKDLQIKKVRMQVAQDKSLLLHLHKLLHNA